MHDEAIYRCTGAGCARALPRPVNFCPYCGMPQQAGVARPGQGPVLAKPAAPSAAVGDGGAAAGPAPGIAATGLAPSAPAPGPATAVPPDWQDGAAASAPMGPRGGASPVPGQANGAARPVSGNPGTTPGHATGARATTAASRAAQAAATSAGAPAAAPGVTGSAANRAGGARAGTGSSQRQPGAGDGPARSRRREPVRLRWWLLALAALWAAWLVAKPTTKKIERRIDHAIALATECKAREAQSELIALQSTRATPEQLQRLQRALNEAAAACTRRSERNKAWSQTSEEIEVALSASAFDKARKRLAAFTRRWGEDADTREVRERIDARRRGHPRADTVARARTDTDRSARNLLAAAKRDLAWGNQQAAADKMEVCLTMVDPSNLDCAALREKALRR